MNLVIGIFLCDILWVVTASIRVFSFLSTRYWDWWCDKKFAVAGVYFAENLNREL